MNNDISFRNIMKLCLNIIKNNKLYHIGNALVWLFISIVPIFTGLIIKILFDFIEKSELKNYYINIGILFFVLLVNILLTYTGGLFDTKSRFFIGKKLRNNLFAYFIIEDHILESSEIINIFNTDIEIIEEFISFCMDFINKICFFIFAFYIMADISLEMTLFVILPLIFLTLFIYFLGNKIKQYYSNAKKQDIENIDFFENIIQGSQTIPYFADYDEIIKVLEKGLNKRKRHNRKKELLSENIERIIESFNYFSQAIIMLSSLFFLPVKDGIGAFTLFVEYMSYGGVYLLIFQEIFIKYKSIQRFIKSLSLKLEVEFEQLIDSLIKGNDITLKKVSGDLPIKLIDYSLVSNAHNISLDVNKGDIVYVKEKVKNGADLFVKSLFGKQRFCGEIFYSNSRKDESDSVNVGYVSAVTYLFNDSLRCNITGYERNFDVHKFNMAVEVANLTDGIFEELLNDGNRAIGVNGKMLSEGQRQRVAIARALYQADDVLLLDNAFSNIDYNNKIEIFKKLQGLEKAIFIIDPESCFDTLISSKKTILIKEEGLYSI